VIGGTAVLCGTWVAVKRAGTVPAWEERVFRRVNGLPDALWPLVWAPMQLGSVAGSLGVVTLTWVVRRDRRLRLAALGASQGAWWAGKVVKVLVSRGRPGALLTDVDVRETASGLGFLSGHAAVAFALASVLTPSVPKRWRPAPFAAAAAVAFGRVYAGAHLPVDVMGGAGLGVLSGGTARWLVTS
jgi:undecaprenyl-diphosphatase